MSSYTITTPAASLNLRPSSVKPGETASGAATYSVTNRTGSTKRVRLRIDRSDSAEKSWFSVREGDEREIAPGATASFSIDLAVPGGSTKHSFTGVAVDLDDSDNDFERGSAISFNAPALIKKGFDIKWWMITAPIALVLVVVAVIVYWPKEVPKVALPDFRGQPLAFARSVTGDIGIDIDEGPISQTLPECDTPKFYNQIVVKQVPESDGTLEVPISSTVKLGWDWIPKKVQVPGLVNKTFVGAVKAITDAGLTLGVHMDPVGNRPSDFHYPAIKSVTPTGNLDACTKISFDMKWRRARRLQDASRWIRELENARITETIVIPIPFNPGD